MKVFAEQSDVRRLTATLNENTSLTKPVVPKLSLAMYPFSISVDEQVPLKCL